MLDQIPYEPNVEDVEKRVSELAWLMSPTRALLAAEQLKKSGAVVEALTRGIETLAACQTSLESSDELDRDALSDLGNAVAEGTLAYEALRAELL